MESHFFDRSSIFLKTGNPIAYLSLVSSYMPPRNPSLLQGALLDSQHYCVFLIYLWVLGSVLVLFFVLFFSFSVFPFVISVRFREEVNIQSSQLP